MPKVSIIVPVYNAQQYIERCARSLFDQTLDEIEYIFIDDCSPDDSITILNRIIDEKNDLLKRKKNVVRIIRMSVNSGQAVVRKKGLEEATGDYILHCDSDDFVDSDMAFELWSEAVNNKRDIVICDFIHETKVGSVYYKGVNKRDNEAIFYDVLTSRSTWAMWNKLISRKLIVGTELVYSEAGKNMGEDMLLVVQLLYLSLVKDSIGYVNKPFYHYCDNPESISNPKTKEKVLSNLLIWADNIRKLESFFSDKEPRKKILRNLLFVKYLPKRDLAPYISDKKYAKEWLNIFKESNCAIILCPVLSAKDRFIFLKSYLKASAINIIKSQ